MTFFLAALIGPLYHKYHGEFMNVPLMVLHLVFSVCHFDLFRVFLTFRSTPILKGKEGKESKKGRKIDILLPYLE